MKMKIAMKKVEGWRVEVSAAWLACNKAFLIPNSGEEWAVRQ